MVVKDARDVGIGALVRFALPSGQVAEDKVVAKVPGKLVLERGVAIEPARQFVKVVGFSTGHWRAVEESERDLLAKKAAGVPIGTFVADAGDRLGPDGIKSSWPSSGT